MKSKSLTVLFFLFAARAFAEDSVALVFNQADKTATPREAFDKTKNNYAIVVGAAAGTLTQDTRDLALIKGCPPADNGATTSTQCFLLAEPGEAGSKLVYTFAGGVIEAWLKATSTQTAQQEAAFTQAALGLGLTKLPAVAESIYTGDKAILFFDAKGHPLLAPHPQIDEDDTVAIVVIGTEGESIDSLEVTKCSAAREVRIGGGLPTGSFIKTSSDPAPKGKRYDIVTTSRCSADGGIEVKVKTSTGAAKSEVVFTIPTLPLYRLTVALGLLYDFARVVEYRATPLKGETVPVINQNEHFAGLNAVAFVSLRVCKVDAVRARFRANGYAWCGIFANPSIGISLSAPTEHLYAGLNLEPWPGLGLLLGYHLFQKQSLADGYQVGDRFDAGVAVPVDKRWTGHGFFLGLALDSTLVGNLLAILNR